MVFQPLLPSSVSVHCIASETPETPDIPLPRVRSQHQNCDSNVGSLFQNSAPCLPQPRVYHSQGMEALVQVARTLARHLEVASRGWQLRWRVLLLFT